MNLKRYIPIVAVAFCLFTSCKKAEESDPEPNKEVEIEFDMGDFENQLNFPKLQELVKDKEIRSIYLIAVRHWDSFSAKNISLLRINFFQKRIEMSSKIRGRGDFDFKLGEASKVPEDSLWFVQQGWTINKKYQH